MDPIPIFPYAALHVAVTEGVHSRMRPPLRNWFVNWREEACKVEWLRLSYIANDADRAGLVAAMRDAYGEGSMAHRAAVDLERLCVERCRIEKRDRHYKSMYCHD